MHVDTDKLYISHKRNPYTHENNIIVHVKLTDVVGHYIDDLMAFMDCHWLLCIMCRIFARSYCDVSWL